MASGFSNAMKGLKEGAGDFVDKHKDEVIEQAKDAFAGGSGNDREPAEREPSRPASDTRERAEPRAEDRRRQEGGGGSPRKDERPGEGKSRTQERPDRDGDPARRDR